MSKAKRTSSSWMGGDKVPPPVRHSAALAPRARFDEVLLLIEAARSTSQPATRRTERKA